MVKMILEQIERYYNNNGQHLEQLFCFNLLGIIEKADNIKHTVKADVNDIQVKSARATVCNGLDITEYLKDDKAKQFAYVTKDGNFAYVMDINEYIAFVNQFARPTTDSKKNGGKIKMRLPHETQKVITYLENAL